MTKYFTLLFLLLSTLSFAEAPAKSNASIEAAIKNYKILLPKQQITVLYDKSFFDRALTDQNKDGSLTVKVGPAAFTSWGLLGSTLAHEIEVHCLEDFKKIKENDMKLSSGGTAASEVKAFEYEIQNKDRFKLTVKEVSGIKANLKEFQALETMLKKAEAKRAQAAH